ncbi:hypothetical protein E4U54_004997 [Claviceps lovelessii]|nr:hypothetical protein E4U54_004997 [Claviceps lovelessii]
MPPPKYQPLPQTSHDSLDNQARPCICLLSSLDRTRRRGLYLLAVLLALSVVINCWLATQLFVLPSPSPVLSIANLKWNQPTPIPFDERGIDDPLWDDPEFDYFAGFVALDHQYAKKHNILSSQNWPWDHSKGIYVLHGYHSLHCVNVLRDALRQFRDNDQQAWPFEHLTHCLLVLREDTICTADDTARYTGHLHALENKTESVPSGVGAIRMCRDWSALRRFALEHSACYYRPLDHWIPIVDRYKRCPDGSTPWIGHEDGGGLIP